MKSVKFGLNKAKHGLEKMGLGLKIVKSVG